MFLDQRKQGVVTVRHMQAVQQGVGIDKLETFIRAQLQTESAIKILSVNDVRVEEDDHKISSILARTKYPTPRQMNYVKFEYEEGKVCATFCFLLFIVFNVISCLWFVCRRLNFWFTLWLVYVSSWYPFLMLNILKMQQT